MQGCQCLHRTGCTGSICERHRHHASMAYRLHKRFSSSHLLSNERIPQRRYKCQGKRKATGTTLSD
nr:MAG TPA: hypothetical protein [Caudoviricetes sp.]